MKLMTYNILGGWEDRIELIIDTVLDESPDILVVNEANAFVPDISGHLALLSETTDLSYAAAAPSGQDDFHVLLFSKKPFHYVQFLTPLVRAGVFATVDTVFGELTIVGTHLSPFNEDERVTEIASILEAVKHHPRTVILGDLNSLSPHDDYPHLTWERMNDVQRTKFTTDRELRFDTIRRIEEAGFVDVAAARGCNDQPTSPTAITHDIAHADTRLDYIFVSQALREAVTDYRVVRTPDTEIASDHYPVVAELKRAHLGKPALRRQTIDRTWFDFQWDFTKIWKMDLPVEELPVSEVAWHLDLPLWEYRGQQNSISPRDVLRHPARHRREYLEIMETELGYPVEVMWWNERWMLLDGVHRLAKAVHLGRETLKVHKVPHERIPEILIEREG